MGSAVLYLFNDAVHEFAQANVMLIVAKLLKLFECSFGVGELVCREVGHHLLLEGGGILSSVLVNDVCNGHFCAGE